MGALCFVISRKVKTKLECNKKIVQVYGEGAVTDQMCQKWFASMLSQRELESIMLSEISQAVRDKYHMISLLMEHNQLKKKANKI